MTDEVVIRVEGLGKAYRISHQSQHGNRRTRYGRFSEDLVSWASWPWRKVRSRFGNQYEFSKYSAEEFWALKDVSFEVRRGEVIGIIGRNGAGKSTLLKILSRITEPTRGRVEIDGRVASLLEVGTGFHPELTGRENVYLNGAILGMSRAEIKKKFDEIVAFAEIDKFLDTPVKRYSSGMYVRLAFAVAAHLEPEILLVDEVLAVGDAIFQKKCLGKMQQVSTEGRTVLFVSHNMASVKSLCSKALLIKSGEILERGSAEQVIKRYICNIPTPDKTLNLRNHAHREGNGRARIMEVRLLDQVNELSFDIEMGTEVTFEIVFESDCNLKLLDFQISLFNSLMHPICHFSSRVSGFLRDENIEKGIVRCKIRDLNLMSGKYIANLAIWDSVTWECFDRIQSAISFNIEPRDVFQSGLPPFSDAGVCFFKADWDMVETEQLEG